MISNREKFREEKQFEKADQIRDELNEMNIELIDHKGKTIWMKKEKIKKDC
jgi:cysteinyl-tRNA synthetase